MFPFDPTQSIQESFNFPSRCAQLCLKFKPEGRTGLKAIDVGCAVGGASFELARECEKVVGVDFSQRFIDTANQIKENGGIEYRYTVTAKIEGKNNITIPTEIQKSRISFEQGDACNLRSDIGEFDIVLASNLLCRLPKPRDFLNRLATLVSPGGVAVLISPYSWLEEYTPTSEWLGGYNDSDDQPVNSFDTVKALMDKLGFDLIHRQEMPFLIREHARKYQWGCSDGCVWKKRS
eukprot:TRINITY_DN5122_c0_g1_i1.p1 TRINITY_DN5122_c0_g1~~TRINITY_DN5122_c0_g1_i1.p1  ORF type:complete len:235 (+),score=38.56 TRINITY_DN5122_c0_g1_i1:145-849(+)